MVISKSIELIKSKLKGSKFSAYDTACFFLNKGLIPGIRGLIYSIFNPKIKKPFFLGKGAAITHRHKLTIGAGSFIGNYNTIQCLSLNGLIIGKRVTIREFGWVQITSTLSAPGDGIHIGDNTYIGPRCYIGAAAYINIGDRCQIGGNVSIIAESHNFKDSSKEIFNQGVNRKGVNIGDDCWIGNNAIILDGVTLGRSCVVGAGAIVTKSFPSKSVIAGNPAKLFYKR